MIVGKIVGVSDRSMKAMRKFSFKAAAADSVPSPAVAAVYALQSIGRPALPFTQNAVYC